MHLCQYIHNCPYDQPDKSSSTALPPNLKKSFIKIPRIQSTILSKCLSIHPTAVCLSVCLSIYLSVCLSVYLSIYLSTYPSTYLPRNNTYYARISYIDKDIITVFWHVTPCRLVGSDNHFRVTCCLHYYSECGGRRFFREVGNTYLPNCTARSPESYKSQAALIQFNIWRKFTLAHMTQACRI